MNPAFRLSIAIPVHNEESVLPELLRRARAVLAHVPGGPHEIIFVDDGSTDRTFPILEEATSQDPRILAISLSRNFGHQAALTAALDHVTGDAAVVMMADESDDCRDVVRYWEKLNEGYDCVFGSRFMRGGGAIDYPKMKLLLNRLANYFIKVLFRISLNDTTNAFKAYRKEVIDGCRPFIAPHFNMTIEIPLKAIVRGYSWTTIPITWRNRRTGTSKLQLKEMGSRYLFVCLYVWLEKYFSRGDYLRVPK